MFWEVFLVIVGALAVALAQSLFSVDDVTGSRKDGVKAI